MTRRVQLFALLLLLVAAASVRLHLAALAHAPTLDTAIVGQMALNILDGDRPFFFAGQNYMGALEAYVLAAIFALLPPGPLTMTLPTIAFTLLWIVVTFLFFRRIHGPTAGLAAATIPALPGWTTVWYTTVPYGGYPETYAFGMVLLLLSLRFLRDDPNEPSPAHALLFAAVAALGVWTNLQIMPYLGAASLGLMVAFIRRPKPVHRWVPYLLIPAAAALALLPQALAEPAHVHPPMFGALSLGAAARSWRALWSHDLKHCLVWTFPPAGLHVVAVALWITLFAGAAALAWRKPRHPAATLLTGGMVALFALTYFPHPMSGFVPRYLIGPVTLLASWSVATWLAQNRAVYRRAGIAIAGFLILYNATGTLYSARARQTSTTQTLTDFTQTIAAARRAGWTTLLHTGSETEGYDGARLTFLAGGSPVFASAFSDRFLEHQLAGEFSEPTVFLSTLAHQAFVLGSFAALNVEPARIVDEAPYILTESSPVTRGTETSLLPAAITGHNGNPADHPLFDRNESTTWPTTPSDDTAARLEVRFDQPVILNGLRARAPSSPELPYRYTVEVQTEDGTWKTVQASSQRIAGSYLSGNQIYFRGHHAWMDLRFPPTRTTALAWTLQPGPRNRTSSRLMDVHLLATDETPWPPLDAPLDALLRALRDQSSPSRLFAERGLLRLLHRHAASHPEFRDLKPLLPLPYNPRFARTLPPRTPLNEGQHTLLLETTYLPGALDLLQRHGILPETMLKQPPFTLLRFTIPPTRAGQLCWNGFDLLEIETR